MLGLVIAVLIGLWLIGAIVNVTLGGLIHLLLVIAVVVLIIRLVKST